MLKHCFELKKLNNVWWCLKSFYWDLYKGCQISQQTGWLSLLFVLVLCDAQTNTNRHMGWQVWEAGFDATSGASPFTIWLSRPPVWLLDEEMCFRPTGLIKALRAITASSWREIDLMPHWSSAENPQSSPHYLLILWFTNSQKKKQLLTTTQLYNPASHAIHRSIEVTPPQSQWPTALSLNHTVDSWRSGLILPVILSNTDEFPRNFYHLCFSHLCFKGKFYVLNI